MPIQTIQYINIGTSPNDGTGDTLRAGGNKINLDLEYIDGLLNNRISFITVTVDWSQSVVSQLRDYVNANPMTVEKDELVIFLMYKNISNDPMSLQLQQYRYLWVLGEGAFGGTNPIATNAFFNLGYVGGENESVYDLGEIGTSNIEDVVNQSGPYSLNSGATVVFQAERSGELVSYLYTGPTGTDIGLGEYQTSASEYTDLTNQQPVPPDLSSFVEFQDLDSSLYDKATPGFSTDIDNFTSLTDPFYLLEDTTANKHYFASKQTNVESIDGSRIYIRETGTHHDMGAPDLTQNGYNFWDLGDLGITINSSSTDFAFQFTLRYRNDLQGATDKGNTTTNDIIVEGGSYQLKNTSDAIVAEIIMMGTANGFFKAYSTNVGIDAAYAAIGILLNNAFYLNFPTITQDEEMAVVSRTLEQTGTQEVALKDDTEREIIIGKQFDLNTTAYANATELISAGYTTTNGYVQGSEIVMTNLTSGYKRYEKISDTDTDWMVYDNSTGWQTLPV